LEWRAERFSFTENFSLLQAMISKRGSSPIIRMNIRTRPPSVIRWSVNKPINQLVNQSLLHQFSFHKDSVPTKDFTHWRIFWPNRRSSKDSTERPPDPIDGHSRSNSYNYDSRIVILYIFNNTGTIFRICHISYINKHAANIVNYFLNSRYRRILFFIKTIFQIDLSVTRKNLFYYQYY
jgi:hypothetical protein